MLWRYSRTDTKVLLLATLLVFSGYALLLAHDFRKARTREVLLTAQTIGVLASVPENGINTLAQQLDARARELDAREATLLRASEGQGTDTRVLVLVGIIGAGLLGLILLNFYLDSKRRVSVS
ncbi:MAG: hypothetical protein KBD24_01915 [Candidatus Pacebacteria bacterium]|nr:hypothetical protein [Candidatus Paceibacterota bacterium]